MIISKLALPRRTFLRGIGAALALPLLDAMSPALTAFARTPASPIRRLGFVYAPNGFIKERWAPAIAGTGFELTQSLGSLNGFRDQLTILSGLSLRPGQAHKGDPTGEHSRASASWLTCAHAKHTEGADVEVGTSADQLAAAFLGRQTALASLELATEQNDQMVGNCEAGYSCVYQNTVCWRNPTTPLPMEVHPRAVFERLFGDGGTPAEQREAMRTEASILDSVRGELAALRRSLGRGDQARVEQYLDSIRGVEQRIELAEARNAESPLPKMDRPVDIPEKFEDHVKLMFDLQVLAYQADLTRVITFMLGRELSPRTFPEIGITGQHHGISHHQQNPEMMAQKARIDAYHVQLFSYYLERLKATPDGDNSLLDNMAILYGGSLGNSNDHAHFDVPALVVGGAAGRLTGNQHINYPVAADVPLANLLMTLLDKSDVPVERFGDSTGKIEVLSGV